MEYLEYRRLYKVGVYLVEHPQVSVEVLHSLSVLSVSLLSQPLDHISTLPFSNYKGSFRMEILMIY